MHRESCAKRTRRRPQRPYPSCAPAPRSGFLIAEVLLVCLLVVLVVLVALTFDPHAWDAGGDLRLKAQRSVDIKDAALKLEFAGDREHVFALGVGGELTVRHLPGLLPREEVVFSQGRPTAMAYSAKQERLVVGTDDGKVVTLDPQQPSSAPLLARFRAVVSCCDVSADGRYAAAATEEGNVGVWDVSSGRRALLCRPVAGITRDLSLSADGSRVAVATECNVVILDVLRGKPLAHFTPLSTPVRSVSLSPDGSLLACGTFGGRVTCWETQSARERWSILEPLAVRCVAFSPDAELLAIACGGLPMRVVLTSSGETHQRWRAGPDQVKSLLWSGTTILYGGSFLGIHRWDVQERTPLE